MNSTIKTFEDACKALGVEFKAPEGLSPDEIAYMKLKIIVKALNEGWEPNWHVHSEWKYYPYFWMGERGASGGVGFSFGGCDCGRGNSHVGSRLCFKSRALAEYAGEQFVDLYKEFFLIQN